ncbi:hypothetical protein BaRGS_00006360 [Batillaria attramentaria]|uniref:Secreted protein n=1 Tax=Batillaria attramentaria TaxID=370345 RepID=A0ABD0LTZ0_9CAEN
MCGCHTFCINILALQFLNTSTESHGTHVQDKLDAITILPHAFMRCSCIHTTLNTSTESHGTHVQDKLDATTILPHAFMRCSCVHTTLNTTVNWRQTVSVILHLRQNAKINTLPSALRPSV